MQVLYIIFGFLNIILGWLLGLLSSPITAQITNYFKRKQLKTVILSELKNLIVMLSVTSHRIDIYFGSYDRAKLKWFRNILEKYRAGGYDIMFEDNYDRILEEINKSLSLTDEQLQIEANLGKSGGDTAISLKPFSFPLIKSYLENLSIFDAKFQRGILEINSQINILNKEIEEATFYFRHTFEPAVTSSDKRALISNTEHIYRLIQRRCKEIADKIEKQFLAK